MARYKIYDNSSDVITPVASVAAYAETLLPARGGIGRYPKDAAHPKRSTGWVHIDTRAGKSRWKM